MGHCHAEFLLVLNALNNMPEITYDEEGVTYDDVRYTYDGFLNLGEIKFRRQISHASPEDKSYYSSFPNTMGNYE